MKMPEYVAVKIMPDKKGTSYNLEVITDADFVNVVRCKDCKFYVEHSLFGVTQGWCEKFCDKFDRSMVIITDNDDFCSHGEKKVEV